MLAPSLCEQIPQKSLSTELSGAVAESRGRGHVMQYLQQCLADLDSHTVSYLTAGWARCFWSRWDSLWLVSRTPASVQNSGFNLGLARRC